MQAVPVIGKNLTAKLVHHLVESDTSGVFIFFDKRLSRVALSVEKALRTRGLHVGKFGVQATESAKALGFAGKMYGELIRHGMDRKSTILAVGGGVIGDLAGFLAGTYLRGIRWGSLPSTLLAQVDSAIGGKTGVNHPLGKNLVGVFHQPSFVFCDVSLLKSLSKRDWTSGLGEIAKYGLLFDPKLFDAVCASQSTSIASLVDRSVQWKLRIVEEDERETTGRRRLLNLGHTVGHAYETLTGYRHFRHGEAVIVGMRAAAELSVRQGHLSRSRQEKIEAGLSKLKTPEIPKVSFSKLLECISRDKKTESRRTTFVLLQDIGRPVVDDRVSPEQIRLALESLGFPLRS